MANQSEAAGKAMASESENAAEVLGRERQVDLLYWMKLTRAVDAQLAVLFRQGKLVGGCYSSLGQEATACASAYALEARDYLGPMIRDMGATLVKGFRPVDWFTQYMGKATSPTGGKDGNAHFGDLKRLRVVAPISHLGSLVPVMAGIAMGSRMLGDDAVCLTYVGDGGAQVGEVHEGLNFAAVQRAALVLIIENNGWAYSTPVSKQAAVEDLALRAQGYGIPGVIVDGNDALEVYRVTREAVERARAGEGPTLIEAKTMRMKGHAEHDAARYMPAELLAEWRERDPIQRFEQHLCERGWLEEESRRAMEERIAEEIRGAVAEAEAAPMPEPEKALEGVFCEGCHETPRVRPVWAEEQ
jgi:TPP-dependent pyruvate/acetoin dehydrogenase alpha subunit